MALTKVKPGNILLTTPAASSNDVTPATTQYVTTALANMVDSAPSTLNTLNELAAALGDDANFSTTVTNNIAAKAPLASPTFTGDVDIDATDDLRLRFLNGSTFKAGIQVPTSTGDMISGAAVDDLAIRSQGNMLFSSGGNTERMRIDSAGKMGIGTNTNHAGSSLGYMLTVDSAGASGSIFEAHRTGNSRIEIYQNSNGGQYIDALGTTPFLALATGGTQRMRIDSSGRVLIGQDSGDAFNDDSMLRIQRTGDRVFQQFKCDADQNIQILFGDVDDDVESSIQYYPADKNLIFTTGNNAEAMRIDSSQNVGIGTGSSSINAPLEISGAVAMAGGWGRSMVLRHNFPTIVWQSEYSTDAYAGIGYDNTTGMHFMVNSPTVDVFANSQKSAMFIRDDKRIGIGTTSPTAKLEISGKDDAEGTTDLLALQFDNSPADTGMTFTDIFSGVQARFTIDSGNTNNLRISSGSIMHFYGGTSNGTGNGHLLINSSGHVGIVAGKRFYLDNASIASGDTYIDEYSANEVGITTGGSRKFALSGGNLYHTGSLNSGHNFSDERLKENIVVIPNALEKVNTLRGITFNRKSDGSVGTGLIAQELETVLPEAVYESKTIDSLEVPDAEEYKAIRYGTTVGLLVEAIKELTTKLEAAEARITTLEG